MARYLSIENGFMPRANNMDALKQQNTVNESLGNAESQGHRMREGRSYRCRRDHHQTTRAECAAQFSNPESICHRANTPCALGQLVTSDELVFPRQ